ncbi:two-component system, chemotaxis family, CheB/CheR fusion protein [Palleronia marisminoris]|uniref:Blue-light-activated histidine kinase n=1 Tax=Palleronia marisminoris TaxID=315423 RepID=A0A1Y5TNS0_9RHOB|nr:chemotaxis protein CheB [Palleronia marisminoris]SFH46328.1 two-component system, chemotaxis family, CheB/CheR fusion protein [Palleronia marisminoris]SLN68343.1 Blue-light-activated histidine kinase [Palleronia marisminoris]
MANDTSCQPKNGPVPICAIGASAGGVHALRSLFRQLPDDLGLAYIVIVHLAPEHPSSMAEILSACTTMDVHQVTDTPELRANCIYVIPPDRELVIEGDNVHAREFTEPRGRRAPVDVLFRSIAAARGDGMAVVLSGAGSDGANGVRSIHEGGGLVLAQDPAEAEFSAMPQNAIATGVVSFIAPLDRLAEHIVDVAKSKGAVRSLDEEGASNDLRRIIGILRARTGHDFSSYKRATVMRRVLRRMQVCGVTSLAEYSKFVLGTPEEAQELFGDLLISVTQFFRDEGAYEALAAKVIGPLIEEAGDEGVRAWSAGCATGEEAYSLAMLMLEEAERRRLKMPIQIFASDLDEGALGTAREGRYPRSIEADVSMERLERFFIDEGTHYRVRKELRDTVLFASHSVLKDPPFMRLDLVACRNMLIYMERTLQEQLLSLFHYGLKPNGALFLGSAETADSSEFFSSFDREARIFRTLPRARRHMPTLPQGTAELSQRQPAPAPELHRDRHPAPLEQHAEALEKVAPPSVLVDANQQILHLSPNAGRFIQHSAGTFSGKLSEVVRPELRLDLKVGLDRALQSRMATMTHPTPIAVDGEKRRIAMQIAPVPVREGAVGQAMVLFLDAGPALSAPDDDVDPGEVRDDEVRRLHAELKAAQESLVASRGEHEAAIEDLRAANEELQSINEEYRATSEELETSKEELQSMNEELQTVNTELKIKLESISTAHSDLQNLTAATEIGTLFLDAKLRIRMFTPPIGDLFNVTEMDAGRNFTDFTHRLRYDDLEKDARRVLRDLSPLETEVQAKDGRCFMMRIRPYRTVEDRIDGVVVTFVDITSRLKAEQQLVESQHRYQTLFNSIDEGFGIIEIIFTAEGAPIDYRFIEVNDAFARQTGLENAVGRTAHELVPDLEHHWIEIYGHIVRTGKPERFDAPAAPLNRHYETYAFPIGAADDHRLGVLFRDISDRKEAEDQHRLLTHELSHRVKNTLTVVQALARQPCASSMTTEQYRDRFVGRIQALAHAHDQLLATNWQSADLATLIRSTLSPYGRDGSIDQVDNGPATQLTPKQGLGLALILHELATNASKYGALSTAEGELRVTWDAEGEDEQRQIRLTWAECGGPPVANEVPRGFGTRLIERACTYELEGTAELRFTPKGLTAEIVFPVT